MSDEKPKPAVNVDIGDRFHLTGDREREIKNKKGQIVTTFRPEFDYPVTPRNREVVAKMIADGVAAKGGRPAAARVALRLGGTKGRADTGQPPADPAAKQEG